MPKLIINKNKELKDKCNLIYSYLVYLETGQINTNNFCIKGDQFIIGSRMLSEIEDVPENEYIPKIIKLFDEQPTYYQIIAFINIFYLQLVKFSKNYMFKCEQLFDEKLLKEGNIENKIEFKIRGLMVQKLIELSKFCSIPAYKKLIESQKKNINEHDKEQNNINQKKNIQNSIIQQNNGEEIQENNIEDEAQDKDIIEEEEKNATNYLASENKLTFDKLPSGFILFCADNMTVRVITNSHNLNEEERKTFEDLYSTQSYSKDKKKSQLPDYKNFTHEDYLKELRIQKLYT